MPRSPQMLPPLSAAPNDSGSGLCRQCGLCCDGSWFDYVGLRAEEQEVAQAAGLQTFGEPGELAFHQPCPLHQHGSCAIYDRRPKACSAYACKLLRLYLSGELALADALRPIHRAKELSTLLCEKTGSDKHYRRRLRQILDQPDRLAAARANASWMMTAVALLAVFRQHFDDGSGMGGSRNRDSPG